MRFKGEAWCKGEEWGGVGRGVGQCLVQRAVVQILTCAVRTVGAAYAVCACTVGTVDAVCV